MATYDTFGIVESSQEWGGDVVPPTLRDEGTARRRLSVAEEAQRVIRDAVGPADG
jgi:hypothetical protein